MHLSLSSWSLPHCTLNEVALISKALGINSIDVGLFYRSALDKGEILAQPNAAADKLKELEIPIANYYHLFGDGLEGRNLARADCIDKNLADLRQVLTFADAAEIPTVFILPGVINSGQSRSQAMNISIANLRHIQELSQEYNATICIEPHVHSYLEAPEMVMQVCDETGVKLALDYTHFVALGYRQLEIDMLAKYAAHIHLRQGKMGELQTKFAQGTINFPALFGTLQEVGYQGALTLEAVHQDYMNTLFDDVLTETVLMRDCFNNWKNGG